jgi:ubiquinone/menaquinone biosynthesis C-methylase UbiE
MSQSDSDRTFSGSIPQLYEEYLVPLIFEPYAVDIAQRVARQQPSSVLEIAAGTGVVTRQLANVLPLTTSIVASDLNQAMIDHAARIGTPRGVEWCQADAMQLPFPDESFDVVVCQFGAMFFPDKPNAFSEARRVLRNGGMFIFSVWDRIEENEFADVITNALAKMFPEDPPRFLARTPHGHYDRSTIEQNLRAGGFVQLPQITTLAFRSVADSPRIPAVAYCEGTPLRNEVEARDASRLNEATNIATAAIAQRFGDGKVDGKIQAVVVSVER